MDTFELKAIEGADAGMRAAVGEGGFVGRGKACRFRLSDPSVQPMHARIRLAGDRYILTDVSDGVGLLVNDRAAKSRPLQAGDRIKLGAVVLEFAVAGEPKGDVAVALADPTPPVAAAAAASVASQPEDKEETAEEAPEPRTPVWVISGVIALIVVAVVAGLWLHLASLRKDVEKRYREVAELAKSGRATSAQVLDRYRGIVKEAEEVHPRVAERLKAIIRTMEAGVSAEKERERAALRDLDAKADELAGRGEYVQAAEVYKNADAALKKAVEDSRAARIAELERLAAGKAVQQGKTE